MDIRHDEIARVAYLTWQRDGCPSGRDLDYWLDAERQTPATWPLLIAEPAAPVVKTPRKSAARSKSAKRSA